jgi:hypothetical protein
MLRRRKTAVDCFCEEDREEIVFGNEDVQKEGEVGWEEEGEVVHVEREGGPEVGGGEGRRRERRGSRRRSR